MGRGAKFEIINLIIKLVLFRVNPRCGATGAQTLVMATDKV